MTISTAMLEELGLSAHDANTIDHWLATFPPEFAWQAIATKILTPAHAFDLHLLLFNQCYPMRADRPHAAPFYLPGDTRDTQLAACMRMQRCETVAAFHRWSIAHKAAFWQMMLEKLAIRFQTPPTQLLDITDGIEQPHWLVGARFNIVDSCFIAPANKTAIITPTGSLSYGTLENRVNKIAANLQRLGYQPGDAIAIALPMHATAVAIYLGIIRMGGVVVSIAESFSGEEIATRLAISHVKLIFTQTNVCREGKTLALYSKINAACPIDAIVIDTPAWKKFLNTRHVFTPVASHADAHCTLLFSSGTTGTPKAIPWTHTTPIKCATDANLHIDINKNDVVCWPTSLGWMMGPWLVFAGLINQATIALYEDAPHTRGFAEFVADASVTVLGVVPTLVASWRKSGVLEKVDWQKIRVFASSGECSNPEDMLYLASRAAYQPIIEYCGGTEIGGAYISSTLFSPCCPSILTTPVMGLDFVLLNEDHSKFTTRGEVALLPPSIGLSTELLNADHHQIYYADMPEFMRRHGDEIECLAPHAYRMLGRADDTMNLSGIKVSSAEIERALTGFANITEIAAIAVAPATPGPSQLVLFMVTSIADDTETLKSLLQQRINQQLNPLFRIHTIIRIDALPRTATGKIMRRQLRAQYRDQGVSSSQP